jgi:RHH-type rel operon transcriptional repressor/antitoxin RelB
MDDILINIVHDEVSDQIFSAVGDKRETGSVRVPLTLPAGQNNLTKLRAYLVFSPPPAGETEIGQVANTAYSAVTSASDTGIAPSPRRYRLPKFNVRTDTVHCGKGALTKCNLCNTYNIGVYMAVVMNIRLPDDLVRRIENLAKVTGRTRTYYVREALEEKIGDMELIYLATKRAEDIRYGKEKTVSWEELKAQNGLSN